MDKKRIEKEMRELELKIHYHFNDISWLAKAMGSIKIEVPGQGKNGSEYSNEGLATVGDTMLKSVIADHLYRTKNIRTKGEITTAKSGLENNSTMDTWLVTLDQLDIKNNKFMMTYDFGENYEFVIEVLEQIELKEIYRIPRVVDGVGYGIVEDGKFILEDYLDGKPLEYPLLFIKRGRHTMLDFNSFDLEECNKKLKREISKIRNAYFPYY